MVSQLRRQQSSKDRHGLKQDVMIMSLQQEVILKTLGYKKNGKNVNQICGNTFVFKLHRWNLFLLISKYSTVLIFI
jgi:hypothetical protein